MKTKYFFTLIIFLLITNLFAQSSLNDYKYVVVQKKYEFLKEADKYQLNSLTKFLLEKENFIVFFDDDLSAEIANNRCLSLYADVLKESSMFKTTLKVQLKNCMNEIVFTSKGGISRDKEFKKAYHGALRDAFQSFKEVNYSYKPKQVSQEVVEVTPIKQPIIAKPVIKEIPKKEVIVKKEELKPVVKKPEVKQLTPSNIFYAQAVNNGFQIVDSTPKVVMILLSTAKQDVFIVKGEDAIVYKEDGFWYKSNNSTSAETLNIKF